MAPVNFRLRDQVSWPVYADYLEREYQSLERAFNALKLLHESGSPEGLDALVELLRDVTDERDRLRLTIQELNRKVL